MKKQAKKSSEPAVETEPDVAIFTSPIGLVRCTFSKKGRLTSCYPLSDEDWPLYGDSILKDRGKHPALAEVFWNGKSIPKKYDPKLPKIEEMPNLWEEVEKIPLGTTISYEELALRLGLKPSSAVEVEQALLKNTLCLLVPCHRVTLNEEDLGTYHWELKKKEAILDYEKYLRAKRQEKKM